MEAGPTYFEPAFQAVVAVVVVVVAAAAVAAAAVMAAVGVVAAVVVTALEVFNEARQSKPCASPVGPMAVCMCVCVYWCM